jgi:hypothetical protein
VGARSAPCGITCRRCVEQRNSESNCSRLQQASSFKYYRFVIIPTSFRQNPLLILLIAIKNTMPDIMLSDSEL